MKQLLFTISVFVLLTACGSSDNIEIAPTINGFETGFIFDDADDFVGDSITEKEPDNSFEVFFSFFSSKKS